VSLLPFKSALGIVAFAKPLVTDNKNMIAANSNLNIIPPPCMFKSINTKELKVDGEFENTFSFHLRIL
jgi:hypothetical protein